MADCPYRDSNGNYIGSIPNNTKAMIRALKTRITNVDNVIINSYYNPITSPTDPDLEQVKQLLNNGYLLHVNVYWDSNNKKLTTDGEEAFCEFLSTNGGHALTIVGYDDSIKCDINGDGIIDPGETGAFKIANSHGTEKYNDGFLWIMYDALNKESQYSNTPNRAAAFSFYGQGDATNSFHYIEVSNQPVNAVALLDINTSNIYNYKFETTRSNYASYGSVEDKYTVYDESKSMHYAQIANPITSFNGTLAFDYDVLDEPASIFTSVLSPYMGLYVEKQYSIGETDTITGFRICDSEMNTIKSINRIPNLNNEWFKSLRFELCRGDLNYDEIVSSDDANILLRYLVNKVNFSDLQYYLADVNNDGVISMADLTSLNAQLSPSEQAKLLNMIDEVCDSMTIEQRREFKPMLNQLEMEITNDMKIK